MAIPSIQLTSAVIALRKVENRPALLEARRDELVRQFMEHHRNMTRKQVTDLLWAKYMEGKWKQDAKLES